MTLETSEASAKAGPGIHCSGYLNHTATEHFTQRPRLSLVPSSPAVPRIIALHWLRPGEVLHG